MTAMRQSSLTPQPGQVPRSSVENMKITLDALRVTILNLDLGAEAGMQMLAEEITPLTGAVGAAIALKTNDQIVCRASVGRAPGVGAVLQPGQGLSGECVLAGQLVRCDDTDVDTRANPQVCRELGFRSVLIAPISLEAETMGLVELLAAEPHHFNQDHVLFLNEVAAVVLELNALKAASHEAGPAPADADRLAKFDVKDLMSALERESEEAASFPDIDDTVLLESLAFIREDGALPAAKAELSAPATRLTPKTTIAKYEPAPSRKRVAWVLIAALIAVILIATWLWRTRRLPAAVGTTKAQPSAGAVGSGAVENTEPRSSANNPAVVSDTGLGGSETAPRSSKQSSERWTEMSARIQAPRRAATLSLEKGSTVLQTAAGAGSESDLTPVPSIAGLNSTPANAPVLPPLSETTGPVFQPMKVSSGLRGGTAVYQPRPAYPEMAKRNGLAGDVVLKFLVTKEGTVTNIRVVSGNPTLALAAVQSVKLWRYRPFLLNGEPTEAESQATIKFTSPR